jgi:hypothetical protein
VSDLAHLPRGLLSLEQWDALELDPTRRWELGEGTLIMSPRPDLWHQRISKRLTRSSMITRRMNSRRFLRSR